MRETGRAGQARRQALRLSSLRAGGKGRQTSALQALGALASTTAQEAATSDGPGGMMELPKGSSGQGPKIGTLEHGGVAISSHSEPGAYAGDPDNQGGLGGRLP